MSFYIVNKRNKKRKKVDPKEYEQMILEEGKMKEWEIFVPPQNNLDSIEYLRKKGLIK